MHSKMINGWLDYDGNCISLLVECPKKSDVLVAHYHINVILLVSLSLVNSICIGAHASVKRAVAVA